MHQIFLSVGKFADFVTEFSRGDPGKNPQIFTFSTVLGGPAGGPPGARKIPGTPVCTKFSGEKNDQKNDQKMTPNIYF